MLTLKRDDGAQLYVLACGYCGHTGFYILKVEREHTHVACHKCRRTDIVVANRDWECISCEYGTPVVPDKCKPCRSGESDNYKVKVPTEPLPEGAGDAQDKG